METYIPTEADISWAKSLISALRHRGIWGCRWGEYQLDKEKKVLALIQLNPLFPEDLFSDMQHKTEQTFGAIGYEVIIPTEIPFERRTHVINPSLRSTRIR